MKRYKGDCDIFFGMEHRLRKDEVEEQLNKEAKERWRFAAVAARITDESAGIEDGKHTSGGAFVAVDSNLGAVVGAEEGTIASIPRQRFACDANMCPKDFEKSLWFQRNLLHVVVPKEASTCRRFKRRVDRKNL